jgi:hypothetical protein
MSYEAWRREVANGTMADWDEGKHDYADASSGPSCWDCYLRMVNRPPTEPHQTCAQGHPLMWYDPNDPECGWFDSDEEQP